MSSQRPSVSISQSISLAQNLFALKVSPFSLENFKEFNSYEDRNFLLRGRLGANQPIDTPSEDFYVLKVLNSGVSKKQNLMNLTSELLLFLLSKNEVECPVPQTSVFDTNLVLCRIPSGKSGENNQEHEDIKCISGYGSCEYDDVCAVRLFSFVPGDLLCDVKWTKELLVDFGTKIGYLNRAMKEFSRSTNSLAQIENKDFIWDLRNTPASIRQCCHGIEDEDRRNRVQEIAQRLQKSVLPKLNNFENQLIHGDINEHNVLVRRNEDGQPEIKGIIDFGHLQNSYRVFDIAIAMAYVMMESANHGMNPIQASGHVLSGYQSAFPLSALEMDMLLVLAMARISQSLVIGAYTYKYFTPDNEYLLYTAKNGWKVLDQLQNMPEHEIQKKWKLLDS